MKKSDRSPAVLLVDDDEDDRFFIERVLREILVQCQILSANSGQQALDRLRDLHVLPDLVLLDVNMPNMTGFELLAQLRQRPDYQHIPVVMLTTSEAGTDRQAAQQLGASDFITKPVTYGGLTNVVRRLQEIWLTPDLPE